ncbi:MULTISPECIES: hypothetical protein [Methylobacter]
MVKTTFKRVEAKNMMPKRKSVIQQIIVLLTVYATLCAWPAVSGSLKGAAEKLVDERLQADSLFKTAGSTPPTLTASKPAAEAPCSVTKTSLKSGLDPSIAPYCHGEFILDNIRVSDAGGVFDISMNVFIRGEADAALEIYDEAGNLIVSTMIPGHRPIPASLYDIFIQNQINVVQGLTDEYPWNDDRDSRQSQMTRDVRISVPAGGRFELTKSSVLAINYNLFRWAIDVILVDFGGANIMQRRINDIAITMGTEVADLFRKTALSGGKPDVSAATKIVASIATVFLDPANLDGHLVFQGALKKAMGNTVFAGLSGVALEGKFFNTLNALWDLYNAGRNTGGAVYWRAPLHKVDGYWGDDIHRIDFRNFTYEIGKSWCADVLGKTVVQVRNGESESTNKEQPLDGFSFFIYDLTTFPIFYGDLTGDKRDEAVVLTSCGGMHPEEQAFIYTMQNGRAVLLTKLEEGNRAFGGIVFGHQQCQGCSEGIKIQNGLLTVERMWGDAACCPKYIEKKEYRWDGRQLIQVGKAHRRKFIGR